MSEGIEEETKAFKTGKPDGTTKSKGAARTVKFVCRGEARKVCVAGEFVTLCIILAVLIPGVPACRKAGPHSEINVMAGDIAIKGYDPVAYFTDMKPVKGSAKFEYPWKGATWRFSSAAHRDMFGADPGRYAPRYGGYCAYAVSQGKLADIDPEAWTVYEGRLYLNLSKDVQKRWERDKAGYIRMADENWPGVLAR